MRRRPPVTIGERAQLGSRLQRAWTIPGIREALALAVVALVVRLAWEAYVLDGHHDLAFFSESDGYLDPAHSLLDESGHVFTEALSELLTAALALGVCRSIERDRRRAWLSVGLVLALGDEMTNTNSVVRPNGRVGPG